MSDIDAIERDTLAKIAAAADIAALEDVRVAALGKKGAVSERMRTLGSLPPEERKAAGAAGAPAERVRAAGASLTALLLYGRAIRDCSTAARACARPQTSGPDAR